MELNRKSLRVAAVCAATLGFSAATVGIASAAPAVPAADTSCLEESTAHTLEDPTGVTTATLGDPTGTLASDLGCAQEVLGL